MEQTFRFIRPAVCAVFIAFTLAPLFGASSREGLAMIFPAYVVVLSIEIAVFAYFLAVALRRRGDK